MLAIKHLPVAQCCKLQWGFSHSSIGSPHCMNHHKPAARFSEFCRKFASNDLTISEGFWHIIVCWVTSWVLKLYWQYSACCEQSSVTLVILTFCTVLGENRVLIWLIFENISYLQVGIERFLQSLNGSSMTVFMSVQLMPYG